MSGIGPSLFGSFLPNQATANGLINFVMDKMAVFIFRLFLRAILQHSPLPSIITS